jgi:hypothetical protein
MIPIEITQHVCWLPPTPAEIVRRVCVHAPSPGVGHYLITQRMPTEVRESIEREDRRLAERANASLLALLSRG